MLISFYSKVAKIDVKQETPVDHGEITCFSIYGGSEADFGGGKSCIWVDVLDGGGQEILEKFADFFSNPSIKKVSFSFFFYPIAHLKMQCLLCRHSTVSAV